MKKLKHMPYAELREEILSSNPELASAVDFATRTHEGQTRREHVCGRVNTPYIEHVLRVCLRLIRLGITDMATLTGALFHDVVEDCTETFAQMQGLEMTDELAMRERMFEYIASEYGADTTDTVRGVTLPPVDEEAWRALPMEERNTQYLTHVSEAISANPRSCLVKISDFLDNGGSLHHAPISKQVLRSASKYLPMVDVFITHIMVNPLVDTATQTSIIARLEGVRSRLQTILATEN